MSQKGWAIIAAAGLMEIVWAVSMDCSDGFTIWYFDLITVAALAVSTYLLSRALRCGIPMGTAYAVWTGIGAVGTISVSVILGNETLTALKMLFVAMIIIGIVGLQLSSSESREGS